MTMPKAKSATMLMKTTPVAAVLSLALLGYFFLYYSSIGGQLGRKNCDCNCSEQGKVHVVANNTSPLFIGSRQQSPHKKGEATIATTSSDSLDISNLALRGAIFHDQSGCGLSKWRISDSYLARLLKLCPKITKDEYTKHLWLESTDQLKPYDTLFIHQYDMIKFIDMFYDNLTTDIIVLTAHEPQFSGSDNSAQNETEYVLEHPHIKYMFTQNPWKEHPKLSGLPQGIGRAMEGNSAPFTFQGYLLQTLRPSFRKTNDVFLSYFRLDTNENRSLIPRGPKRPLDLYYNEMVKSRWVLSPDGDRPGE